MWLLTWQLPLPAQRAKLMKQGWVNNWKVRHSLLLLLLTLVRVRGQG